MIMSFHLQTSQRDNGAVTLDGSHEVVNSAMLLLVVAASCGLLTKWFTHRFKVSIHYSILCIVLGFIFGFIEFVKKSTSSDFVISERLYSSIPPQLMLIVFIAPLLFDAAFNVHFFVVIRALAQSLILAFPGVGICSVFIAVVSHSVFNYPGWTWPYAFLLGSILGATDPVATVAILRDVGGPAMLTTILEGESLFNDGSSYTLFVIFLGLVADDKSVSSVGAAISLAFQYSLGGPAFGIAFGIPIVWFLGKIFHDHELEIGTTLVAAYICFWISDLYLNVSAFLAVVLLGLYLNQHRYVISSDVSVSMRHSWDLFVFLLTSVLFVLTGVIISEQIVNSTITWLDFCYAVLIFVTMTVARFTACFMSYPVMPLNIRETLALSWGGLRGAVSLSLALVVVLDARVDRFLAQKLIFIAGFDVFLTLLVYGTTFKPLIISLKLHRGTAGSRLVLRQAMSFLQTRTVDKLEQLAQLPRYSNAQISVVKDFLPRHLMRENCCDDNELTDRSTNNHEEEYQKIVRAELSRRFLLAMQSSYWDQASEGRLINRVLAKLQASIEHAIFVGDFSDHWHSLSRTFRLPWYLKAVYRSGLLNFSKHVRLLFSRMIFSHMSDTAEIAGAFLVAKQRIEHLLNEFPELRELDDEILNEVKRNASRFQVKALKAYLDVSHSYPEALGAVQTRHIAAVILRNMSHQLEHLLKQAAVQESEHNILDRRIKEKLWQLDRSPSRLGHIKLPSSASILFNHPLFAGLAEAERRAFLLSCKRLIFEHGDIIFEKGARVDAVLLILRGTVSCIFAKQELPGSLKQKADKKNSEPLERYSYADNASVFVHQRADGVIKRSRRGQMTSGDMLAAFDNLSNSGTLYRAKAATFVTTCVIPRNHFHRFLDCSPKRSALFASMAEQVIKASFFAHLRKHRLGFGHVRYLVDRATIFENIDRLKLEPLERLLVLRGCIMRSRQVHKPLEVIIDDPALSVSETSVVLDNAGLTQRDLHTLNSLQMTSLIIAREEHVFDEHSLGLIRPPALFIGKQMSSCFDCDESFYGLRWTVEIENEVRNLPITPPLTIFQEAEKLGYKMSLAESSVLYENTSPSLNDPPLRLHYEPSLTLADRSLRSAKTLSNKHLHTTQQDILKKDVDMRSQFHVTKAAQLFNITADSNAAAAAAAVSQHSNAQRSSNNYQLPSDLFDPIPPHDHNHQNA